MIHSKDSEIAFAIEAVRQASLLAKQLQTTLVSPSLTKEDHSPVTIADYSSQALIAYLLAEKYPEAVLVAEENSDKLRNNPDILNQITAYLVPTIQHATSAAACDWIDRGNGDACDRFWLLDPIDGTKGFLRGHQYVVALSLVEDGQVKLGVIGCPNLVGLDEHEPQTTGFLVIASSGNGCWAAPLHHPENRFRLSVSDCGRVQNARMLLSYEKNHTNQSQIDLLINHLGIQPPPVRMDSQAKYALLAGGHGEFLVRLTPLGHSEYREKIWDQAAGSLVVQEAGGTVTDLDGFPLDFSAGRTLLRNRGVLVSTPSLHETFLRAIETLHI